MKQTIVTITALFLLFCFSIADSKGQENNVFNLNLDGLKLVAEVDERYQSFNIEMCEVVGGEFWIPYDLLDSIRRETTGRPPMRWRIPSINLYEKKIRMLASALGPMYIRVSGTWANTTYFQDNDEPKLEKAPDGYENVLTRKEWKNVIDFCKAVDAKLVTSFAISNGIRDDEGNWTPAQVEPLINYTKSIGGEIAAAEMFNEPSHATHGSAPEGYNAEYYAKDFAAFKSFVDSAVPEMKIMGPGSTGEGGIFPIDEVMSTDKILTAEPTPDFEIFSYHFYGGASQRCGGRQTEEIVLSDEWLCKTELGFQFYKEARDKYLPGAPIWLTETAEAACGGDPLAATYLDCFRYLEQLGRLAKKDVKVVMHNTLSRSEYAILDHETYKPRPNYWAALLWNKLMGTEVYDPEVKSDEIDVFIHNLKNSSKGYAVLIVNPKNVGSFIKIPSKAMKYMLTAEGNKLQSKTVKLNDEVLTLTSEDSLPEIKGKKIKAGKVKIPAYSILFLTFQ